jgi:tetratricopeptide (TPR) repeat protein
MLIVAARASETRKTSPKVADLMLRARAIGLKPESLENTQKQQDLYRQVLALEPNNASAMAGLAGYLTFEVEMFHFGMNDSLQEEKMVEGYALALRAKELDPDNQDVYVPISMYAAFRGDWEGSRHADETLLALDPKNPTASNNLAVAYFILGEPQRAIDLETQAIKLNPKHPHEYVYFVMGMAYFMLGDNDAAIGSLLKSLEINPTTSGAYAYLAMAYALKGEDAKAHAAAAQFRQLEPNSTLSTHRKTAVWHPPAKYEAWFESKVVPAWRKAGLPE